MSEEIYQRIIDRTIDQMRQNPDTHDSNMGPVIKYLVRAISNEISGAVVAKQKTNTAHDLEEFWVLWFESTQEWKVVFCDGSVLSNNWGAVGYAVNAAYEFTGRAECEFMCMMNEGEAFWYQKDAEFWGMVK
jgi:hypothetical protein